MEISFSDRLQNILAFTNALGSLGGEAAEARNEAKRLESQIHASAESEKVYQHRCDELLARIQHVPPDAESPEPEDDLEEIFNPDGPEIGGYKHATFHADGQMSTVFKARARDPSSPETVVALKVTMPSAMLPPHNSVREARLLVAARHPNIVPLLESFSQPGSRLVLVFPFLRQDLENLLRSGVLTRKQSSLVFQSLFGALAYVHSLGMIHRDVKPSNILLQSMEGPAYLTDFGIAWSPSDPASEAADDKITDVGTTSYRAPELLFGCRDYNTSLDIWAAGCVVAEMMKPDHRPVFDAGPLGSELGLIKSMFSTLGTPNEDTWPSARTYPDWGKMRFQDFPGQSWTSILPGTPEPAIELVQEMICYEPTQRQSAAKILQEGNAITW